MNDLKKFNLNNEEIYMGNRQKMRAAVINKFGSPEVLSISEIEKPVPQEGEVLIKIEAAGINRLDHYVREGGVVPNINFPHVLGSDAVGVIEDVGSYVHKWKVGDRVIPMPGYPHDLSDPGNPVLALSQSYAIRGIINQGTYAEYMTIPEEWLVRDTTGLTSNEVASLPMPLITAVRTIKEVGSVRKGDYVLIHAGASGTGSIMIQVAIMLGAKVATTIRTEEKRDFVKSLGAELVLDMNDENYVTKIQQWSEGLGVDVVVDNLGGTSLAKSLECTKPLGTVVLMGNVLGLESTFSVRSLFFPQKKIVGSMMGNKEDLQWGLEQIANGRIKPTLMRTYSLDEIKLAHQDLAEGNIWGNAVIDMSISHD